MTNKNAKAYDHEHLPPPVGVRHEQPITTTEALKQLYKQDPAFARWVLIRSEEIIEQIEELLASRQHPRDADLKEEIAALLIGARELGLAGQANRELQRLLEAPAGGEE